MKKLIIPIIGLFIIIGIYVVTSKKEQQQNATFENYCLNRYNDLEQQYQNAKGLFNDDKIKIANVKTGAIRLRNEGCDKYLGNNLNELIKKCDDALN